MTTIPKMKEEEYTELVMQKIEENHIWLNKLIYISPTNEEKIKLADMILDKLKCKSCQIPSRGITSDFDTMREIAELTPTLYLNINWS